MNKTNCCGCSACVSICPKQCITMQVDEEGFLYPWTDKEKCINCGLCDKVCMINHPMDSQSDRKGTAYACINISEEDRLRSSSGGIFPLLAKCILAKGGKVYGAAFDEEWLVQHVSIGDVNNLSMLQGSKYMQSDKKQTFVQVKRDLDSGKEVLFSGTPCEVRGLKSFLQKEYEKLTCVDVVCHGVPSPLVWRKYIAYIEKIVGKPRDRESTPSHRLKSDGWSRYSVSIPFSHDTEYRKGHDKDLYMRTFLKDVILRPSCYECICKPSTDISDISLADFWGIEQVLPCLFDDKGTSLVIVNSQKGNELFKEIQDKMKWQQVGYQTAVKYNPAIYKSPQMPKSRGYFFEQFGNMDIERLMHKVSDDSIKVKGIKLLKSVMFKIGVYKIWRMYKNRKSKESE